MNMNVLPEVVTGERELAALVLGHLLIKTICQGEFQSSRQNCQRVLRKYEGDEYTI